MGNYVGRAEYHAANGPLVDALNDLQDDFPSVGEQVSNSELNSIRRGVLTVCREGKKLFKAGGSLYTMLDELEDIFKSDTVKNHFRDGFSKNEVVKKALQYFAGPTYEKIDPQEL